MAKVYLPELHRTVVETIKGKRVQKWVYPDKSYGICEDGKVTRYFPDGKTQIYNSEYDRRFNRYNYVLAKESLLDGTQRRWFHDGELSYEKLPDGTIRSWYENGKIELEKLPDGSEREFFPDGKMSDAKLPDGTIMKWEHYQKSFGMGGTIKNERINNILTREWYENGQLAYKRSPNGEEIRYDKWGKVTWHATKGVEDTEKYLEARRIAKRQALRREELDIGDSQDEDNWQFEMLEQLRQKALSKYEEAVLATKAEIESDDEETPKASEEQKSSNTNSNETSEEPKAEEQNTPKDSEVSQNNITN